MKTCLFSLTFFLFFLNAPAQTVFNIQGTVKSADGKPVEAATVFINGSKQITKTDSEGKFSFPNINPGTYQLVVNMIGFASVKENVIIQNKAATLAITLAEKQISLTEVEIGDGSQRRDQIKTFLANFLGQSKNAKSCTITNTDLLDFSTRQTLLEATTSDFLIIENKNLGYKIRYLLRNRQEGFLTYNITNRVEPLVLDPHPVDMEQFLFTIDSNFVELKFKRRLYIYHNRKEAAVNDNVTNQESITKDMGKEGSIMQLYLENAIVDRKGSYVDYRSFYIQGYWGKMRIGDQLPFEYQPGD